MHPDYLASRYAAAQRNLNQVLVQHHHAHLAACLADYGEEGPVIGAILDGTGYGLDGHTWGGEFLVGDARGFQRAAHLQYLPLPGGEGAIHKPYRLALAYLHALLGGGRPLPPALRGLPEQERQAITKMVERRLNTPLTSSAGRLFDAVSALLGVCQETSYEAQAAIELEMVATPHPEGEGEVREAGIEPYPCKIRRLPNVQQWGRVEPFVKEAAELRLGPLFAALLDDVIAGVPVEKIAWRFHLTVAQMIVTTCERLRAQAGLELVALSGGCFQNRLLLSLVVPRLQGGGFRTLTHRQVPCNDGGIALGQAVVAHYALTGD